MNEHELVTRALQGNQKAFRTIVESHHAIACAAVRAVMGDCDEVADVLQNVFLKVYKGLARFRGDSKLSSWIYRIARNEAINTLGRRGPDRAPLDGVELPAPERDRPDTGFARRQLREHLEAALARLDDEQRMAVELFYLGERSYNEIAEMLEMPLGTVKTHIYRGKIALRRILRRELKESAHGGEKR